ncbi:MAG: hypothetical protein IJX85_12110 [Lachnospiraceae bacterium]|nr:hypothetical protein [Lachnospiraceae bacterium]
MNMIYVISMMVMLFGMCMFVRNFKLIDNQLEDREERTYVRREAINRCLFYGNVVAMSGGLMVAKLLASIMI